MTDREALYRAVLASPADDLPRLILADWLDEHGDPARAAYVRAAVDLARLVAAGDLDADAYVAAVLAVASVPTGDLWRWAEADGVPLPPDAGPLTRSTAGADDAVRAVGANLTLTFRRGFVVAVGCTVPRWLEAGPGLAANAPLERVVLNGPRPFRRGPAEWVWRLPDSALGDAANVLPAAMFDHLPDRQGYVAVYRTRPAAEAALSAACMAYARPAGAG